MLDFLARRSIEAFGRHYAYDVDFLRYMLDHAPRTLRRFGAVSRLAAHRETVAPVAVFAAKLVGTLHEDCGPCVQLVADMAREAGVTGGSVKAVLAGDVESLDDDAAVAYRFASALATRGPGLNEARAVVRDRWGDQGVVELTMAVQIGRLFPMVKVGLGFAHSCQRVLVDGRPVAVEAGKAAA